jgi:hypothetical protein
MSKDEEHLQLLSTFHYVVGGLAGLFALFPIFHLIFGLFFIFGSERFPSNNGGPPPAVIGWLFVAFAVFFITLGWVFAIFVFIAGRFLAKRKHYLFCLTMAGVECLFLPFGTVLGVFTIITLSREPVKQLFIPNASPPQPTFRGSA